MQMNKYAALLAGFLLTTPVPVSADDPAGSDSTVAAESNPVNQKRISPESLDAAVKKELARVGYLVPEKGSHGGFDFTVDASVDSAEGKVHFDLTAKYGGEKPFSEKVKLRYILCGARPSDQGGWTTECMMPAKSQTLLEKDDTENLKPVQPGETLQKKMDFKIYGKAALQRLVYFAPHVNIDFPGGDAVETELVLGMVLRK